MKPPEGGGDGESGAWLPLRRRMTQADMKEEEEGEDEEEDEDEAVDAVEEEGRWKLEKRQGKELISREVEMGGCNQSRKRGRRRGSSRRKRKRINEQLLRN